MKRTEGDMKDIDVQGWPISQEMEQALNREVLAIVQMILDKSRPIISLGHDRPPLTVYIDLGEHFSVGEPGEPEWIIDIRELVLERANDDEESRATIKAALQSLLADVDAL